MRAVRLTSCFKLLIFCSNIVLRRCGELSEEVRCGAKDSNMGSISAENNADVVTKVLGSEKSLDNLVYNLLPGVYGRTSLMMVWGGMGLDGFLSSGAEGDNLNLDCNEEQIVLKQNVIYGWMEKPTSWASNVEWDSHNKISCLGKIHEWYLKWSLENIGHSDSKLVGELQVSKYFASKW
jgi:hypothetical protein